MELTAAPIAGGTAIRVRAARIDAVCAVAFKDRMRVLTGTGNGRVVLDLAEVSFIDSSGLGAIVAAMKALAPRRLELAALSPLVAQVFRLTRMDTVFRIHASAESAAGDDALGRAC